MKKSIRHFVQHLRFHRRMAENTVRAYAADLGTYERFLAARGATLPGEVSAQHAEQFLAAAEASGLRTSTRRRRLASLRAFHRFCHLHGITDVDPTTGLRSLPSRRRLPGVLTEEQIVALLAACDDDFLGIRLRAAIELTYSAALRVSELVGLSRRDVALEAREIRITGKGAREAVLPFGESAAAALERYLAIAPDPGRDGPLFVTPAGGRLAARSLRGQLDRLGRRVLPGVRVHPHALRHSAATHLYLRGADLLSIKELLRHRQIETTLIYTHFDRTRMRDVLKRFHPRG